MRRASTEGVIIGTVIADAITKVFELSAAFVRLGLNVGRYQDIAEKTQSDPAGLASFRTEADIAGVSIDSVGMAMNRMALQLAQSNDESRGAARALKSINIEIADFRALSPGQQYRTLAKALEGYAEGQNKVNLLQNVMGRGGAEQIVLMKELAKENESGIRLTNLQIAMADDVADSLARVRSQNKQLAEYMAVGTLPALEAVTRALNEAMLEALGFDRQTKALDNTAVQDFAFEVAKAFAFMADSVRGSSLTVTTAAKTIGAMAAQAVALGKGILTNQNVQDIERNIRAIGDAWREDVGAQFDAFVASTTMQDRVEKAAQDIRARLKRQSEPTTGDFSRLDRTSKPAVPDQTPEKKDAYKSLMEQIREFTAAQELQAASGDKVTAGQRLQIKVYEELDKLTGKGSLNKKLEADAALQHALALEKENAARERAAKVSEQQRDINRELLSDLARQTDEALQRAKVAEYQADVFGFKELERLEIARLRDTAAELRRTAVVIDGTNAEAAANQMLSERADALEREARARGRRAEAERKYAEDAYAGASRAIENYMKEVKQSGFAAEQAVGNQLRTIEDGLTSLFTNNRVKVRDFVNQFIAEWARLNIIRPFMQSLIDGGVGSLLTSALGFGTTSSFGFSSSNAGLNDPGFGSTTPLGGGRESASSFTGGPVYISIDSGTDQARVATMVAEGVSEGNRQFAEQLKAAGAL